jgi:UDP-N-acetylglucosamine--N-acetylmuramyl-(pentapeptide) pyrophosphoryl-undecaprenol N-acetylglucosamine transferase
VNNSVEKPAHGAPISVVLAGGGTAGHVEPAMAVADALTALDPNVRVTSLGTARGLETTLVPDRGYRLELITPVPLPRKLNADLARLPLRVAQAVRQTRAVLDDVDADVVIGFGGYVALPAYLAARGIRRRRVPVVIHEANARAGLANRIGVRTARRVLSAVGDCGLRGAEVVGVPVRPAITTLDRAASRPAARGRFGFADDARVLLVFGGSQGARSITRPSLRQRKVLPLPASRCSTRTDRRTRSTCRNPPTAIRRMSPCPTWIGWTWPTPPPTWRSAGPGR